MLITACSFPTTQRLHSLKFTLVNKSHSQHSVVAVRCEGRHFLILYACAHEVSFPGQIPRSLVWERHLSHKGNEPRARLARMVAQECTSTSRPQRDRLCSALCPHYVRTTPVVFPHRFRSISAIFPHCSRGISALLLLRSLSAPFPRHLRSLSALFPRSFRSLSALFLYLRTVAAVLPLSFRCPSLV